MLRFAYATIAAAAAQCTTGGERGEHLASAAAIGAVVEMVQGLLAEERERFRDTFVVNTVAGKLRQLLSVHAVHGWIRKCLGSGAAR
jgi:hypothetical protein